MKSCSKVLHAWPRPALSLGALLRGPPPVRRPFPSKPIRIVVPFGAGGVADLTARTVAQKIRRVAGPAGGDRQQAGRRRRGGR